MKILVISQVFYPDNVSVAQHLSDLCFALVKRGHVVNVLTDRYPYELKNEKYLSSQVVNGVSITRIWSTGYGKRRIFFRLLDFCSFNFSVLIKLLSINKKSYDLIIGLTAPPLLSYFGAIIAKKKSIKFCYWIMDMQPELAINSGLIKKNSIIAKILVKLGRSILDNSDKIVVLDKYMHNFLVEKYGIPKVKISIVPLWPVIDNKYSGSRLENPFRIENSFGDKIVIMYSGNHSYVHPLDTLLKVAIELKDDVRFLFVFIGGGVRVKDVIHYKDEYKLHNIVQLPYQPREKIHLSLGSSDLQVVILGNNLVGFTHPNKIYGALFIGKPIIYIGPDQSHVTEILAGVPGNIIVAHGDVMALKRKILDLTEDYSKIEETGRNNQNLAYSKYLPETLINEMCKIIECI